MLQQDVLATIITADEHTVQAFMVGLCGKISERVAHGMVHGYGMVLIGVFARTVVCCVLLLVLRSTLWL